MLASMKSIDTVFVDTMRQVAKNSTMAQDAAHYYLNEMSTANRSQMAAIDSLQQDVFRSALNLQNATTQASRSVVDAASALNRALIQLAATMIWPWAPLGTLTEPAETVHRPSVAYSTEDEDPSRTGDAVMSALRFLGPMGFVASGLGEAEDA